MELFPFQIEASTAIADRFAAYAADPLTITRTKSVPFYQNLNSITGSGKTLILADAISQIRSHLPVEPIVLWLSKGKVVVWQTFSNLSSGKYAELISGFTVKPLMDARLSDIENTELGLILVSTVGKFNQADKEKGDRKIYQLALDDASQSLWDMLKQRRNPSGQKRPFIVVYDEGHNLTDQQPKLLLDLGPDALIAASATMRIPPELAQQMNRLRQDKGWKDDDFVTYVKSGAVVDSGLVKQQILLGGYVTPMEVAIDDMMDTMKRVDASSLTLALPFRPKAVYVSNTNAVHGGMDNVHAFFESRQARPILIWRHLVEHHGINPADIAVYCNLKFEKKFPPPYSFNLFSGGDNDYETFVAGNFRHIIFNLTLQEGWDDPTCYFAYIDKDMGSRDQITQIIGRVLRQPQAQHYQDPSLNTAHFFIRADERAVFDDVLREVQAKISAESPEITLTVFKGNKGAAAKTIIPARKEKKLPEVSINTDSAMEPIHKVIVSINDYRTDKINTVGTGGRIQVLQTVGKSGGIVEEWVDIEHNNRVTARWIFVREVQKTYVKAINLCDIENPKFDALIEYNSPAAEHIREAARKIVTAYIDNSNITNCFADPLIVPSVTADPTDIVTFTSSIHEGYSGFNSLELEFAKALDKTQRVWFRNPSRGLFEIPLLAHGGTKNFNPDFIVWADKGIVAIDTKGDHLIFEDSGRKLFSIDKIGTGPDLAIHLVTRGMWNEQREKTGAEGFTVWSIRNGRPHPKPVATMADAVTICLRQK
ncbi:MAG: DEAD/DEAH box helicase family protein [Nitrospirae bacterium]|nr:DEAD/DEAH box helicase family protein [Nitrospirota bacterium]